MAQRKKIVEDRKELANIMTKFEMGKSQIKVGDAREFLRILVGLECTAILSSKKSIVMMIRREAKELAKKKNPTRKF